MITAGSSSGESKWVLLMKDSMPVLSLPNDASAMDSSYCLVSKLAVDRLSCGCRDEVLQLAPIRTPR